MQKRDDIPTRFREVSKGYHPLSLSSGRNHRDHSVSSGQCVIRFSCFSNVIYDTEANMNDLETRWLLRGLGLELYVLDRSLMTIAVTRKEISGKALKPLNLCESIFQ